MNCQDAHDCFSALLDGDIGLTERVPLEAHLRKCAECRQGLEDLQQKEGSPRPISWRLRLRRSVIPRIPAKLLAVAASVMLVAVLVLVVLERRAELELAFRNWVPSVPSTRDSPPQPARPLVASTEPATRSETSSGPPSAAPLPAQSAPSTPPAAVGAQLRPTVVRDVPADRSAKPRVVKPGQTEQQIPKSKSGGTKREGPPGADPSSQVPVAARAAAPGDTQRPVDVVGRLLVKSRSGAERDVAALLARAGGTTLSRQRGPAITVVKGVVPHSNYGNFAAGLRGIGSWQLEAERSPLPNLLHVTVRRAE
jgi:Putative zinc-finger